MLVCHRFERCSAPKAATALYHPEAQSLNCSSTCSSCPWRANPGMLVCHRSERCKYRFQMPDVLGLPLSCGWTTAVAAASRLVTLFFGRTVSRKWYKVVSLAATINPFSYLQLRKWNRLLLMTAQIGRRRLWTPLARLQCPPQWLLSTFSFLQFELRRLQTPLARLLRCLEIWSLPLHFTTLRPIATKCNQVRQGQCYCAGHRHQEGTEGYTTKLGNKNFFFLNLRVIIKE